MPHKTAAGLRGPSAAAKIIGVVALAVAAGVASAGVASTVVIYRDGFAGTASTPLNGTAPGVGPAGAKWTAGPGWMANGSQTSSGAGNSNAYLPCTVAAGHIYTLSAGLNPGNVFGGWFGLGFVSANPPTGATYWFAGSGGGYLNPGPWLQVTGERGDAKGNEGQYSPGPGHSGGYTAFPTTSGVQDVSIVLNTTATPWTFRVFDNGKAASPVVALKSKPKIIGVALGDNGNPMANGTVSHFSLTVKTPEKGGHK